MTAHARIRRNRIAAGLTPKQQLFVAEYLKDLNATAAYTRAGYKGKGKSAESNASILIGNHKVRRQSNRQWPDALSVSK